MRENGRGNGRVGTSTVPEIPATRRSPLGLHPLAVDPLGDLIGIEADVFADLDERDPSLGDQSTDEPHLHAEPRCNLADAEEWGLRSCTVTPQVSARLR